MMVDDNSFDDYNNRLFVTNVLSSELDYIMYLPSRGLFLTVPKCRGRCRRMCGRIMVERLRRGMPIWRCPDTKCCTTRSFASTNDFFLHRYPNSWCRRQISLTDIAQLAWFRVLWSHEFKDSRKCYRCISIYVSLLFSLFSLRHY